MENLSFINLSSSKASDNEEIFLGLKKISQKEINSKYFYNEIGSKLFDQISKDLNLERGQISALFH